MVVCGHIEAKKLFIFSKKAVEIKYYKKYKKAFQRNEIGRKIITIHCTPT
jgi:hypothetical protein